MLRAYVRARTLTNSRLLPAVHLGRAMHGPAPRGRAALIGPADRRAPSSWPVWVFDSIPAAVSVLNERQRRHISLNPPGRRRTNGTLHTRDEFGREFTHIPRGSRTLDHG